MIEMYRTDMLFFFIRIDIFQISLKVILKISNFDKIWEQVGSELGQAQLKLGLDVNFL